MNDHHRNAALGALVLAGVVAAGCTPMAELLPHGHYAATHDGAAPRSRPHAGLDYASAEGAAVLAAAAGIVTDAVHHHTHYPGEPANGGRYIAIDHALGLHTRYYHLAHTLVEIGDRIEQGMIIATVGRSGCAQTGCAPHLHFELHTGVKGHRVNPTPYIAGCAGTRPTHERPLIYPVRCRP